MFLFHRFDFIARHQRKNPDVFFYIFVRSIQPELVELIRGSFFRIEPYIPAFCLAEFCSVGFFYQRSSKRKCFSSTLPPDELSARYYVAPLIAAAHLHFYIFVLPQVIKIVTLNKLVRRFGERYP